MKNRRLLTHFSLAIAIALCLIANAHADIIHLSDGRRIVGYVIGRDEKTLNIQTPNGNIIVPAQRVKNIEPETPAQHQLQLAEANLRQNKAIDAERHIYKAIDLGATHTQVRKWCVTQQDKLLKNLTPDNRAALAGWAELTTRLADMPSNKYTNPQNERHDIDPEDLGIVRDIFAPATTTQTQTLTTGNKRDFSLIMANIFANTQYAELAAELLLNLDNATLQAGSADQTFLRDAMIRHATQLLAQGKFRETWQLAHRMRQIGMEAAQPIEILTILRWTSIARQAGHYTKALEALENYLMPRNEIIARERMIATILDARQKLPETNQFDTLIALYNKYGETLPALNARHTTSAIYRQWGQALLKDQRPTDAKNAFKQYYLLRPTDDYHWIDQCEFQEKALEIQNNDHAAHFRLAEWAEEKGLLSNAVDEYLKAAQHPKLQKLAYNRIKVLRESIGLQHLQRCITWLENGDPEQAKAELDKFEFFPETLHMRERVQKLRESVNKEIIRRSSIRAIQAETRFQNAERQFFIGRRNEAIQNMRSITEQFSETKAALRAEEFLSYARVRTLLEQFEATDLKTPDNILPERDTIDVEIELKILMRKLGWIQRPTKINKTRQPTTITPTTTTEPTP